jgi:hypothetical protein
MIGNTPKLVEGNRASVNFLLIATDWMLDTNFVVDPAILKDLRMVIRMRTRAAKSMGDSSDAGHTHFLCVLHYCVVHLTMLPRMIPSKESDGKEETSKAPGDNRNNRFEIFMVDAVEDDEMDDDSIPSTPPPRPEAQPDVSLTIEELLGSDQRHDSILFLLSLEELMTYVADQYQCVKKNQVMGNLSLTDILEAAVSTNMAIQQVQQLEAEFQQQHPELTTPYRVLATLCLPELTQRIAAIVREHGESRPLLEKKSILFLGDCFECLFRSKSDPDNKRDTIVQDFCTNFQVNETGNQEISKVFLGIEHLVIMELPLYFERGSHNALMAMGRSALPAGMNLPPDHSWLKNMPTIGDDRAIHHTIRLLQAFATVISTTPENQKVIAMAGIFGPSPWRPGRAKKIHGDLDELFMTEILPEWVVMFRKGIWSKHAQLPREAELSPLFVLIRQYVETPGAPITWSFAFAVHAMLTAIFETDGVFDSVIDMGEALFNLYFDTLDFASDLAKNEPEMVQTNELWGPNMFTVAFLRNFGLDVFGRRALWNPLFGGTTFSYLCFFGNLEAGCTLIDCQAQLRITLHLFHALKVNGLIRQGEVPFLETLHEVFKSSRGVWEGALPQRGEFVKRFWICCGVDASQAKKMSEEAKAAIQSRQRQVSKQSVKASSWKRGMKAIEPAEIAKSYRRICDRDFHDVVDMYHTEEQRRKYKGTDFYAFAVRANDTLDAIASEEKLLCLHLPWLSVLIEQFVCSLGKDMLWEPLLASGEAALGLDGQKRQGFVFLFAQFLLGALDYADDPLEYEFMDVCLGQQSSFFMSHFFQHMDKTKAMWF